MPPVEPTAVSRPKAVDFIPGYRLDHVVGKGGMGEVYQAVQLSLGRKVALKLLSAELAKDAAFVARFEKEGAALAALSHPNIVAIVDKGKTESTYYLVMEFVDGPSLREVMRSPLYTPGQALHMFAQVCRAIDYAHQRGIIHRDLKPENILFDEQAGGIAKVTDFGLAGFEEKDGKFNLTQTHVAMGTASYMAPEQMVDARKADARADIYSLGVLLYELLVGETPKGNYDPPSVKKAELDKRLDPIVSRCLKQAPGDRYASVGELLKELEPLVPVTSMVFTAHTSPGQRFVRKARDVARSTARVFEAAVVLCAVAIIVVSLVRDKVKSAQLPAGMELTTDSGGKWPLTTAGRVDKQSPSLTLGDGPDTVPVVAVGRKVALEHGNILFVPPEDTRTGRAVLDVELKGDGMSFSAEAFTQESKRSWFDPIRALFTGPRPNARSALMLVGEPGRYVALIIPGNGDPPSLEWALGEKRGSMSAPLVTGGATTFLELKIDPSTGELAALVGKGRDQRLLADSVTLGPQLAHALRRAPPRGGRLPRGHLPLLAAGGARPQPAAPAAAQGGHHHRGAAPAARAPHGGPGAQPTPPGVAQAARAPRRAGAGQKAVEPTARR